MNSIWINGRIIPATAPALAVMDRSFLLGDGCFSTLVAPMGRPFRLEAHWQRLMATAVWLDMPLPASCADVGVAIQTLLNHATAGIRLTLSRGEGGRGLMPSSDTAVPTLVVMPFPLPPPPEPARIMVAPWRVDAGNPVLRHKLTSYAERMTAFRQAHAAGYDEVLFLNTANHLTSAAAANLFMVQDGVLLTPPVTDGVLPGITRQTVLDLAEREGIPVAVRSLTMTDLGRADEMFLTSSRAGVWPVRGLERCWQRPPGDMTSRIDYLLTHAMLAAD